MNHRVDATHIAKLQNQTDFIRNICILAHIDHGKTTLSDSLVCSNGFISPKLAGKLRFLDSTEDEQKRGITMHSSAISLLFRLEERRAKISDGVPPSTDEYLINLVDSPGHIDFSSDVSTATRLCDGAIIVIDVLEGLCTQTHAVLYKALKERLRPCLVLNKIDRLILELQLSPLEAFHHLRKVLENANALAAALLNSELIIMAEAEEELKSLNPSDNNININNNDINNKDNHENNSETDRLVAAWTFAPEKGNILFASAIDCWGFSAPRFATIWSQKLGVNKAVLQKYLFEDYYFNNKLKKIVKCNNGSSNSEGGAATTPMFATLVLEPIWQLYKTCMISNDPAKAAKMAQRGMEIELPAREINTRDPRSTLQAIMRRWLPLADGMLRMVVRTVPSPIDAQKDRLSTLFAPPRLVGGWHSLQRVVGGYTPTIDKNKDDNDDLRNRIGGKMLLGRSQVASCSREVESIVIVYIAKMTSVRVAELSPRDISMLSTSSTSKLPTANDVSSSSSSNVSENGIAVSDVGIRDGAAETFMALARVFSGVLRRDSKIYVLGHRHDPFHLLGSTVGTNNNNNNDFFMKSESVPSCMLHTVTEVPSNSFGMYICFGPSVMPVEEVPAGNIVGIVGLHELVLKTGTLASSWAVSPMSAITFQAKPVVRVAVEPLSHRDLSKLEAGLQRLYQYDPVVEIGVDDSGQHTMTCIGELHLEQCLKALTERFARCEVKASAPLVPFRETVLPVPLGYRPNYPPPWSDLLGISEAIGGKYTMSSNSGAIAISIRCCPLPLTTANLLEEAVLDSTLLPLCSYVNSRSSSRQQSPSTTTTTTTTTTTSPAISLVEKDAFSMWQRIQSSLNEDTDSNSCGQNHAQILFRPPSHFPINNNSDSGSSSQNSLSSINEFRAIMSRVVAFGPRGCGSNMLILAPDMSIDIWHGPIPSTVRKTTKDNGQETIEKGGFLLQTLRLNEDTSVNIDLNSDSNHNSGSTTTTVSFSTVWSKIQSAVTAGFQSVAESGPLMQEPLYGICFVIDSVSVSIAIAGLTTDDVKEILSTKSMDSESSASMLSLSSTLTGGSGTGSGSLLTGQLISEVRDALRLTVLASPTRVVEPIFACNLQCDQSQLGNLYSVLSRRRGEVTKEDIIEGTSLFLLSATIPVCESFGFAQELLKKTSGSGTAPQLLFSHWSVNPEDPFWKPTTEEELEDHGDQAVEPNKTRLFIDTTRKRKGLPVEEKIVVHAEKQRTLTKMK